MEEKYTSFIYFVLLKKSDVLQEKCFVNVSVNLKLTIKYKMTTDATSRTEHYTLKPIKQK